MSKRILVVDDSPDARETVRFILEAEGYDVLEACDGQMGVETAKSFLPDLIVLDMMMPKKDGFVASMEIKRDPKLAHIPIVVLSGIEEHIRGDSKNVQSGLRADVFMQKPVDPNAFVATVNKLLESRQT